MNNLIKEKKSIFSRVKAALNKMHGETIIKRTVDVQALLNSSEDSSVKENVYSSLHDALKESGWFLPCKYLDDDLTSIDDLEGIKVAEENLPRGTQILGALNAYNPFFLEGTHIKCNSDGTLEEPNEEDDENKILVRTDKDIICVSSVPGGKVFIFDKQEVITINGILKSEDCGMGDAQYQLQLKDSKWLVIETFGKNEQFEQYLNALTKLIIG